MKKFWTTLLLLSIILVGAPLYGATVDVYLQAGTTVIPNGAYHAAAPVIPNDPNGVGILMWGYALCTANFASCGAVTVPGPALTAHAGDTLNIHLKNNLIAPASFPGMKTEPTSMIIPGQSAILSPVWTEVDANGVPTGPPYTGSANRPAGNSTARVRSFTTETPVGPTPTTYTWPSVKTGTYLYQTGTHPGLQVQMGLYGALKVYPALPTVGQAYSDPSTAYNTEVTLLYSEIDPELHNAVSSGRYGTPPPPPPGLAVRGQMTSPVEYHPQFFLINGTPYTSTLPPIPAGTHGQKTLIRFLNAGLKEKTPTILNQYMNIIAEDGNLLTYTRLLRGVQTPGAYTKTQYSVLLPAGKTLDAIITPPAAGNIPVFDRSLNLTDGAAQIPGGMLVYLGIL